MNTLALSVRPVFTAALDLASFINCMTFGLSDSQVIRKQDNSHLGLHTKLLCVELLFPDVEVEPVTGCWLS